MTKKLHPRIPLNGTVGQCNNEEDIMKTHLYRMKVDVSIHADSKEDAARLFHHFILLAYKRRGIWMAENIDTIKDLGLVDKDIYEDILRTGELSKAKREEMNDF